MPTSHVLLEQLYRDEFSTTTVERALMLHLRILLLLLFLLSLVEQSLGRGDRAFDARWGGCRGVLREGSLAGGRELGLRSKGVRNLARVGRNNFFLFLFV